MPTSSLKTSPKLFVVVAAWRSEGLTGVKDGTVGTGAPNTEFAMLLSVEIMDSATVTVSVPDMPISSLKTSPKLFVVVAAWRSEMLVLGGSVAFGVVVRLVILTVSGGRVKGNCRSHDERSDRMAGSS